MATIKTMLREMVSKLPWVRAKRSLEDKYIILYNEHALPVGRVSAKAFKIDDKYRLFPIPEKKTTISSSSSSSSSSDSSTSSSSDYLRMVCEK